MIKKCGNCGHLIAPKGSIAEKIWAKELIHGICEMSGKSMSGSLLAGCFYWCDRRVERESGAKKSGERHKA